MGSEPAPAASASPRPLGAGSGLLVAAGGFVVGLLCASLAVGIVASASGRNHVSGTFAATVASLVGLWVGLAGAPILRSRARHPGTPLGRALHEDYGLELRPWPDLGIGIGIGIGAQYLLVPLLELPLLPFVPHLYHRLGDPARTLTGSTSGGGLVLLGLLVCLGSPLVEELFFRGLLLRGLRERFGPGTLSTVAAVVLSGLAFGLAHFEPLQFLGLAGFGIVLGWLACATGRLGPGIVAHATFNTVTFLAVVAAR